MILDWTVALFFKPDVTKVELPYERNETPKSDTSPTPRTPSNSLPAGR
jgi:hypothetical protein